MYFNIKVYILKTKTTATKKNSAICPGTFKFLTEREVIFKNNTNISHDNWYLLIAYISDFSTAIYVPCCLRDEL